MATSSNLPAITASLERDLRTWTDRVRDMLNATGDDRLVRQKELMEYLDKLKSDIASSEQQFAANLTSSIVTGGSGSVTNISNSYGSELAKEIERVLLAANNTRLMNALRKPFNDELLKRINELRAKIEESLAGARGRIDEIRDEYTARMAYEEQDRRAAVYQEYIARQDGDAVLSGSIELLDTRVGDNEAAVLTERTARTSADEALATSLSFLDTKVGNNSAAILDEQTARTTADEAFAERVSLLDARVGDNTASILDERTVRATADTTLASSIQLLDARVASNAASILTEETTRAAADSVLANRITSVTTTLNGYTTSIQTLEESVDGISATYTVKIDNNGFVSGFGLTSDLMPDGSGAWSEFAVNVNQFTVGTSAADEVAPFTIVGGKTYINTALIRDASIDTLRIGPDAVTVPVSQINLNTVSGGGMTAWREMCYATLPGWLSFAQRVLVLASCRVGYAGLVETAWKLTANGVDVPGVGYPSNTGSYELNPHISYIYTLPAHGASVKFSLYWAAKDATATASNGCIFIVGLKR